MRQSSEKGLTVLTIQGHYSDLIFTLLKTSLWDHSGESQCEGQQSLNSAGREREQSDFYFYYLLLLFYHYINFSSLITVSFSSCPPLLLPLHHPLLLFSFRKVQVLLVYQQITVHQISVSVGTSSLIKSGQGSPVRGKAPKSRQQNQR